MTARRSFPGRHGRDQRGAAIISALLVVTLAALLVTALFYRENVAIRSIENRAALAQVRWVERAAVDWARVVIAADYRVSGTAQLDHLGEIWAQPIPETRLDENATGGMAVTGSSRDAFLAGQIVDAQSRFNLNTLVTAMGLPSVTARQAFRRLLAALGLPEGLEASIAQRLLQSQPQTVDNQLVPPLRPPLMRLTDLLDIPGIDPEMIALLRPHVTILPGQTKVNLNTCTAEVMAAVTSLDPGSTKRSVRLRETKPYTTVEIALDSIGGKKDAEVRSLVDIKTAYFIVGGYIRYDRVESYSETLLYRSGSAQVPSVKVVWQQRS